MVAGTNETFLPFDEERYLLIRDDGTTESLNGDQLDISPNGKTLQRDLGSNSDATLIASLKKLNQSKAKN